MKRIVTLIILCLTYSNVFSQKACYKFIPFYNTYNVKNLAKRITNGLKDDSSKVVAIHCWITHYIKYDVKKFFAFDYRKVPVKTILRKRKATCVGYSDLFNELCKHSNIISTSVTGYTKNHFTDMHDTFYIEDHVWNAVYINNEWKLVDACWDTGYIIYPKRNLYHHAVYFLTFGNVYLYKIKPHFKFNPTTDYLLKDGSQFNFDHLPLVPIWQLTDSIVSIREFENDSSFYFGWYRDSVNNTYCTNFEGLRMNFYAMSDDEKDIYLGPTSHKFNTLNHHPLALSKLLISKNLFEEIDISSEDTLTLLSQCDSVLNKLDTAIIHFDSSLFYLVKEKGELEIKNRLKNEILKSQNRELIASTRKSINRLKSVKLSSSRAKKNVNRIQKNNRKKIKVLIKDRKIEEAKPIKNINEKEVENLKNTAAFLNDSIAIIKESIKNQFAYIDSLFKIDSLLLGKYSKQSSLNSINTGSLILTRLYYFDDLDYEVRRIKDSIYEYKFAFDSLLLDSNTVFIIKAYFAEINKIKSQLNTLYKYRRRLGNIYVRLKKHNVAEADELYYSNLNAHQTEINNYSAKLNTIKFHIKYFRNHCKKIAKKVKKYELRHYKEEVSLENQMYSERSNYIKKRHRALTKNINSQKKRCYKIKKKTNSIERKYKKAG